MSELASSTAAARKAANQRPNQPYLPHATCQREVGRSASTWYVVGCPRCCDGRPVPAQPHPPSPSPTSPPVPGFALRTPVAICRNSRLLPMFNFLPCPLVRQQQQFQEYNVPGIHVVGSALHPGNSSWTGSPVASGLFSCATTNHSGRRVSKQVLYLQSPTCPRGRDRIMIDVATERRSPMVARYLNSRPQRYASATN